MAGREVGGVQGEPFSLEGSMAISFDDIVIYFSPDEWRLLTKDQKQLYWDMLEENYQSLLFVGGRCPISPEEVVSWVENNEYLKICMLSRFLGDLPPGILFVDKKQPQMDRDSFPEQVGPLKAICKEEDTYCSDVEGHPCVSATEQRSVPDSGGQLRTESMEWASGDASTEDIIRPCYVLIELLPVVLPVVVPEKSAELPSRNTTIQPQHDFAMSAEDLVEEIQFADATCDENSVDVCCQAVAPALARSTRKAQDTRPSPLAAPTEERKRYFCAWCKEPFKLQINLEVHYRYCRQKQNQPRLLLKGLKVPSELDASGSGSTGDSADSVLLPQKPAQGPSSNDGERAFSDCRLWQLQQRQRVVKYKDMFDARRGTTERVRKLAATTCAMKKLWRCLECEEKFVYKWQFMAHLRSCTENVPGENHLPPESQGLAAKGLSDNEETQEPCVAPVRRPSTSKGSTLYPCDKCGKNLSKCYIPTHRAFHEGQRYKCMWCGKVFNFRSAAVRHKKQHYKLEEDIKCPNCGKPAGDNDCFCMIKKITVAPDSDGGEQSRPEEPK
ncbi:zinc finger protein 26-like isoform X1 [Pantherophis guttatus]|uniref:Zinc finger protein 26-like isoform X1 n=2 Tax=Pantherophis guttatus TaxID=94885 RepID=A0A6P9AU07_PANGU|nr:zinc finger protein 26-like isoform X1 [Pantherophis guttatus]